MKSKNKFIKICPKCGSIDMPVKTNFTEMLMPTPEKCSKCSYAGLFPEIDINEIESFRKELKKKI